MERFLRESTVADETSVRDRMRARAREQRHNERGPFQTPEWLDHSFVLPASDSDDSAAEELRVVTLPGPRLARQESVAPVPVFERPTTPEIDFVAVMRRADIRRQARVATACGLLLALVAVIVFQVTSSPVAAGCAILFALGAMGAATLRVVLNRTPVPYREA